MKSKIIILTLVLAGCGQNQEAPSESEIEKSSQLNDHSTGLVFTKEVLPEDLIPNGRWLINKRVCSKQLLPGEYYDFTVSGSDITSIGITQSSTWYTADPSNYSERLLEVIAEQASCLKVNIDDFYYVEHVAPGNKFTLAVNLNSHIIVRFQDSGDNIGSLFDRNQISEFEVIMPEWYEKLEPSLPDNTTE